MAIRPFLALFMPFAANPFTSRDLEFKHGVMEVTAFPTSRSYPLRGFAVRDIFMFGLRQQA
jgi:hypothetical protein